MSCFNVDPEFALALKFPKSRGGGEFEVVYMESAFDKEAGCGEFYLEFGEYIWEYKLVERFEAEGACQVNAVTFGNNDGHESASNALLRVLKTQEKTGLLFTKGVRPAGLAKKVQEKLDNAKKELMSVTEWDEKTKTFVTGKLESIENNVQGQAIKLEKIENDVQSQSADVVDIKEGVKSQAEELVNIRNGVCVVIPDYQRDNAVLREALVKKTAACDSMEGRLARQTLINKRQMGEIAKLKTDMQVMELEKQAWLREKSEVLRENATLKEQLDLTGLLKCMLEKNQYTVTMNTTLNEELQRTADVLASTLEEERAAKRARV